jgi:hypothetical protein
MTCSPLHRNESASAVDLAISVAPSPQHPPLPSILAGAATFWPRFMRLGSGASHWHVAQHGGLMANVVNDFLLFSCWAAFVTGIVLAAASLLI